MRHLVSPVYIAAAAILILGDQGIAKADDTVAAVFAKIRPSLAIVVAREGSKVGAGSAFCIESDDKHSYFLTNNHVLIGDQVSLRVEIDGGIYSAQIVRRGTPPIDAAVLEIDRGNLPTVVLAAQLTPPGTHIAVAGYPSFHLNSDLNPSIHLGAINSILHGGTELEHDAVSDHGNSGGPLFDQESGVVYGINTAAVQSHTSTNVVNLLAVAITATFPFLGNAKVAYKTDGSSE